MPDVDETALVAMQQFLVSRKYKHVNTLTSEDAAYLAGFIDGEGTITIARSRNCYTIRVLVTNTDLDVLEWIKKVVGKGSIRKTKKRYENWNDCYVWALDTTYGGKELLSQLLPYLKIKTTNAILCLGIPALFRGGCVAETKAKNKELKQIQSDLFGLVRQKNRRGV